MTAAIEAILILAAMSDSQAAAKSGRPDPRVDGILSQVLWAKRSTGFHDIKIQWVKW